MRRLSVLLSFAAILLGALVTYSYLVRARRLATHPPRPIVRVESGVQATAQAWSYHKDDPQNNCPIVQSVASSFRSVHEPSTFELTDLRLRLFNKGCSWYTYVQAPKAQFDEYSGVMTSAGQVLIVMKIPRDKEPEDKRATERLVHVHTSGVRYETKSGKVDTDKAAEFAFGDGHGTGVGLEYDPNTHALHVKSQVSLFWVGNGPEHRALHVEAGDLRYDEGQGKVYLSPWSRLTRESTVVNAADSEVTLSGGVLQQIVSLNATGTDTQKGKRVIYGGDKIISQFNDNGDMTGLIAEPNAHLVSEDLSSRTSIIANKAALSFDVKTDVVDDEKRNSSVLRSAVATGNAQVISSPLPVPDKLPADTRTLRSNIIEIAMDPDGRAITSLQTNSPGELEIAPNQPTRAHRWLKGDHIKVMYGEANSVDSFYATNASTRTEKPQPPEKRTGKDGKPAPPPSPAFTWSNELSAKFTPKSNDLATLEQKGNFRYEEGVRHATSETAFIDQMANRITLNGDARLWDDTGTTSADKIILNQQSGDMDAIGQVASTREPEQQQPNKNSGSLLDSHRTLEARAGSMETRDNNYTIKYSGNAVLWQGADRLQADSVVIDRDAGTVHASGHVISQLVSHQDNTADQPVRLEPASIKTAAPPAPSKLVVYTLVKAPEMFYQDDQRLAYYTGGVEMLHDKTTVVSNELRAFLTNDDSKPAGTSVDGKDSNDSGTSLDHAFADGNVRVTQTGAGRSRRGLAEHCEYFPKDNKVVLNGGGARMVDSRKGTSSGRQVIYWSNSDHVLVEGNAKSPVTSEMKRHQ